MPVVVVVVVVVGVDVDMDNGGDGDDSAGGVVTAAGDGVVVAGVGEYAEGDDTAGDVGIGSREIGGGGGAGVC